MDVFVPSKLTEFEALYTVLLQKYELLKELDAKIFDQLLENDATDDNTIATEVSNAADIDVNIQTWTSKLVSLEVHDSDYT